MDQTLSYSYDDELLAASQQGYLALITIK